MKIIAGGTIYEMGKRGLLRWIMKKRNVNFAFHVEKVEDALEIYVPDCPQPTDIEHGATILGRICPHCGQAMKLE